MSLSLDRQKPLVPQIVEHFQRMAEGGQVTPGGTLPSVRKLAAELRVAPMTVVKAYGELRHLGLIEAKEGSSTRLASPAPRPEGESPWSLQLERTLGTQSAPPEGTEDFRIAMAELCVRDGLDGDPHRILATTGGAHGRSLALEALTLPGDRVAIEVPGIPFAAQWIREHRRVPIAIPRIAGELDLDAVEQALRRGVRVLIVAPDINQASGDCLTRPNRDRLSVLLEDSDAALIEDRTRVRAAFDRTSHALGADLRSRTVVVDSFASLAPDLRIGFLWSSPEMIQRLTNEVILRTGPGLSFLQSGVAEWSRSGGIDRLTARVKAEWRQRLLAVRSAMDEEMPRGVIASRPEGGRYLWMSLPRGQFSDLARRAINEGLPVQAGSQFVEREGDFGLRLNYGAIPPESAPHAIRTLGKMIRDRLAAATE